MDQCPYRYVESQLCAMPDSIPGDPSKIQCPVNVIKLVDTKIREGTKKYGQCWNLILPLGWGSIRRRPAAGTTALIGALFFQHCGVPSYIEQFTVQYAYSTVRHIPAIGKLFPSFLRAKIRTFNSLATP